jgi:hypothetical protein
MEDGACYITEYFCNPLDGVVCYATPSRNVTVSNFDVPFLLDKVVTQSSVLDALGYPDRCLSSICALPLSKEFLRIQTCSLNLMLVPYTLLTIN